MAADKKWVAIRTAEDVTQEIAEAAYQIVDGWYQSGRIDWNDVLDRLDGTELSNGSQVDLGDDSNSPAIREIKARVRKMRSAG